ncbi:hypothetical protein D3C76_1493010 [compost metagenome]
MRFALIHQRGNQQFGTVIYAFDLELHKVVGALAQGLGGTQPLLLHQGLDTLAQFTSGNADKAPGLHQANTGGLMRGLQQACKQFRGDFAPAEVAHVTAFANGAVDRRAFGFGKGMLGHGHNSAADAWGLEAK